VSGFDRGVEHDFARSLSLAEAMREDVLVAYAMQGGLGLPDKSYYFDADKQDKRDAYVAHVAKVLELSGVPAADAAAQARQVMAFETRLAEVSKSREELSRDVSLYYNPVSPADADKLAPNFPWTKFFESQGVAAPKMFSLAMPEFHAEVSEMLGQIESFLARWLPAFEQDQRAYLTVAIGCTGGQHRSVYFAEQLAQRFHGRGAVLVRHRELDAR